MPFGRLVSKVAALALLAGVAALCYALVVAPVERHVATLVERIEREQALLARLGDGLPATATTEPDEASRREAERLFLAGQSDAVMAARLEAILRTAARDAPEIRTTSTRTLAPREVESLRLVGLEARFSASLASLQQLLLALDSVRPVVLVQTLQVSPATGPGADSGEPRLDVRIEVYGAARRASAPSAALDPTAGAPPRAEAEPRPLGGSDANRR